MIQITEAKKLPKMWKVSKKQKNQEKHFTKQKISVMIHFTEAQKLQINCIFEKSGNILITSA